jgi:hypothetical protein
LKRVSITEIVRRIGYKKWIEKRKLKLPKTSQIVDEHLESLENFMLRKLKRAEKQFLDKRTIPTYHQLIRRAVINNYTTHNSERLQNEIAASLRRTEYSI